MNGTISNALLEQFFEPIVRSPEIARMVLDFRVDRDVQVRVDELADKANEGTLTDEERNDYEAFIEANDLIAILKIKARNLLEDTSS